MASKATKRGITTTAIIWILIGIFLLFAMLILIRKFGADSGSLVTQFFTRVGK